MRVDITEIERKFAYALSESILEYREKNKVKDKGMYDRYTREEKLDQNFMAFCAEIAVSKLLHLSHNYQIGGQDKNKVDVGSIIEVRTRFSVSKYFSVDDVAEDWKAWVFVDTKINPLHCEIHGWLSFENIQRLFQKQSSQYKKNSYYYQVDPIKLKTDWNALLRANDKLNKIEDKWRF